MIIKCTIFSFTNISVVVINAIHTDYLWSNTICSVYVVFFNYFTFLLHFKIILEFLLNTMYFMHLKERLDYIWFIFTSILLYCDESCRSEWTWSWSVAGLRQVATVSTTNLCSCVCMNCSICSTIFVDVHVFKLSVRFLCAKSTEQLLTFVLAQEPTASWRCQLITLHFFTHNWFCTENISSTLWKHETTGPIEAV